MNDIQKARDVLAFWRDRSRCDNCDGRGGYEDSDGDSFMPTLSWTTCYVCEGTGRSLRLGVVNQAYVGGLRADDRQTILNSHDRTFTVDVPPEDAALIVGCTNPDLLDAIDGLLLDAVQHGQYAEAERIAAAIIAADERMQQ